MQVKKRRNPAKGQCSNAPVLASLPIDLKLCASNTSSRLFICSTSRLALVVIYIFVNFVHISLCSRRSWTKKRRSKRLKGVRHMLWTSPLSRRPLHRHARQFRRHAHRAGCTCGSSDVLPVPVQYHVMCTTATIHMTTPLLLPPLPELNLIKRIMHCSHMQWGPIFVKMGT